MSQQKHRLTFLFQDEPESVSCLECGQQLCRPANMTDDVWRANLARFVEVHPLQVQVKVVDTSTGCGVKVVSRVRVNWTVRESVSR